VPETTGKGIFNRRRFCPPHSEILCQQQKKKDYKTALSKTFSEILSKNKLCRILA
jgi:hypothetical protein